MYTHPLFGIKDPSFAARSFYKGFHAAALKTHQAGGDGKVQIQIGHPQFIRLLCNIELSGRDVARVDKIINVPSLASLIGLIGLALYRFLFRFRCY
ncbi:hypothetical protein AVEN_262532-1 [Araneus ventricosus]|uniref:Uncharacterized protein n=1 Tax=Araneus ventricosus TaxID=182803 RepID=A0A4Y2TA48_ARAVE|nr:hypothetical protein AVEN_262532-1 [Araneus ventricosus]